jgi:hypothetical protein
MAVHTENCARCHQLNIDTTVNPSLREVLADTASRVCGTTGDEAKMLICDACNRPVTTPIACICLVSPPAHCGCMCPSCTAEGITEDSLQQARQGAASTAPQERDLFPSPSQRSDDINAQRLDGVVIDTTLTDTKYPVTGRLSYVLRDQRSAATRRKPLLLTPMDPSLPALPVTLQKALKPQHATLQLPAPPTQASALVAISTGPLPDCFDLRDPEAVMGAHAAFGLKLARQAANLFISKYLEEVTDVHSSDCAALLGCLSLYPCKRIIALTPDPTLADSLLKRYGIAISSHT